MDIEQEETFIKQCYKCEGPVFDNLKIVYNSLNSKIVLWNKYQIFVYDDIEFESPVKVFVPEFLVHRVIASNNHLLCLDCNDNVHITSLKFKHSTHKRLKTAFELREKDIKTCIRFKDDHILTLKYDAGTYLLCLHRISFDFELEKKIILCSTEHWPIEESPKEKYLLTMHTVNEGNFEHLKKLFKTEGNTRNNQDLIVLSFDKFTLYGCLFAPMMIEDEVTLVKLYNCPAEICNMEIVQSEQLYLLIGLTIGTVMRISLNDLSKTPEIVHLNTALYKMVAFKNYTILYSDGVTMWKSEDTFSNELKLTQFFVTNTYDFVKCGDQILCTTFTKLIYKFSIEDKNAYLIPKTDEYCAAETFLNNNEYLNKLFKDIDKNNELSQKISREQDYITALSLSNRQDLMSQAIKSTVLVLESYNETNGMEFTLTEEIKEYFEDDNWLFLVKILNTNIFNTLNDILSHLSDSISIHLTLSSPHKILKTTSIKMEEPLKTVHFLIPLNFKPIETEINMNIKLLVNIPGALDTKDHTMSILYSKDIVLTSEHFIKTSNKTAITSLKKPKESIHDLIQKTALIQHGSIFKFTDVTKFKGSETDWSFYVKLPNHYEEIFKTDQYCKKYLSASRSTFLTQQWSTKEFLTSNTHILLVIGNEKFKIEIENDGLSNPLLKVTGGNAKMAFNLRNFFSMMIYNEYEDHEPDKEFISSNFYTTVENIQKAVRNYVTGVATFEEFLPIMDQFEKNVVGALPI